MLGVLLNNCNIIECQFLWISRWDITPLNRPSLTLHANWPCIERNFLAYKATGHLKLGLIWKMKTLTLQKERKNIFMKADFSSSWPSKIGMVLRTRPSPRKLAPAALNYRISKILKIMIKVVETAFFQNKWRNRS